MAWEEPGAPLTIHLFGGIEVWIQGQPLPQMRSRKELQLLALLALAQGHPLQRSALAQTLWPFPDYSVDRAAANLRRSLRELRAALGGEAERLPTRQDGVLCLDLENAEVDVVAFNQALAAGHLKALETAVALHHQPLLLGHTETWAEQEREAYRQKNLRALRMLSAYAQQHNDLPAQIAWLRQAITQDPHAEALHRTLMEALVRNGETAAALLVYQELSRELHRLCNRTPDPVTTSLFRRILAGQILPSSPGKSYLPYPLTTILGRTEETRAIQGNLKHARLVTLTGMGGVGKTRLATHVAHQEKERYGNRIWFIDLSELTQAALIPEAIAAVLELDLPANGGQPALRAVQEGIGERPALLLLDNCEHLHPACVPIVKALLAHCGGLRLLATSRLPLGLPGETLFAVSPLRIPELTTLRSAGGKAWMQVDAYPAIQLFAERAAAARSDFYLHADNIDGILQICRHMDGIPLAIELAAARVHSRSVEQIVHELEKRFSLPEPRRSTAPLRQRTLEALIDWSYELLTTEEKELLARLAILHGSWDAATAQALCVGSRMGSEAISAGLEGLADHSLLLMETGRQQTHFRMLETVRRYAQERLEKSGLQATVWGHYRDHFLKVAAEGEQALRGSEQAQALIRLEQAKDNLRTVLARCLEQGEGEKALRLSGLLWRFWYLRGYYAEGADWLDKALAAAHEPSDSLLLKALTGAGNIAYIAARPAQARACYTRCLEIQQARRDERGINAAMSSLANVMMTEGDYPNARALFERLLGVFREMKGEQDIARTLGNLALAYAGEKDYAQALPLHRESVAVFRHIKDGHDLTHSLNLLASTLLSHGDLSEAEACLQESLTLSLALESRADLMQCLSLLIDLIIQQKKWDQAAVLLGVESAFREAIKIPQTASDSTEESSQETQIQRHLTRQEYQAAYQHGCSLSISALPTVLFSPAPPSQ